MSEARRRCESEQAQMELAASLARRIGAPRALVHLTGDLGAGKTTFVRGYLRGLGYGGPVRSPTYTLVEPYLTHDYRLYHLDLYRLSDPEELEYLGLRDILSEPALVLVEWPERGEGWLPLPDLAIEFSHAGKGRLLDFRARSEVGEAWLQVLGHLPG